jgi:hypothetical protein
MTKTKKLYVKDSATGYLIPPRYIGSKSVRVDPFSTAMQQGDHLFVTLLPDDGDESDESIWEFCLHCGKRIKTN